MNQENEKREENEEVIKKDKEENEEVIKKDKEERRRKKEERRKNRAEKKYSEMINYPNMKVEIRLATERDTNDQLFNNMFDENQVICQNNVKRYVFCSTIFILYALIGFMYYTYIY
jgi:outer membrane translocation and assembly module TamA